MKQKQTVCRDDEMNYQRAEAQQEMKNDPLEELKAINQQYYCKTRRFSFKNVADLTARINNKV